MDNLHKPNFGKSFLGEWMAPLILGLLVTLWQVGFALSAAEGDFTQRYRSLTQWDGGWYRFIIVDGYHAPPIEEWTEEYFGTVGFFPGYPLTARLFYSLGMPVDLAMPFTAQLYAWLMWTYWFVILNRWNLSAWRIAAATLCVVSHPMAFFLVSSYSESMCLAGFLGLMIWIQARSGIGTLLAIGHGIALTSSRIVGVPLGIVPLLCKAISRNQPSPSWSRSIGLTVGALMGAGLFFLFCQIRFGHWDMYQKTQQINWKVVPDYTVPFTPSLYIPTLRHQPASHILTYQYWDSIRFDDLGYVQTALGLWFFPVVLVWELLGIARNRPGWKERFPYWFAGAVFFYLAAIAHYSRCFGSVTRHYYVSEIPLVLALSHGILSKYSLPKKWFWILLPIFLSLVVILLVIQYQTQGRYLQGLWVA